MNPLYNVLMQNPANRPSENTPNNIIQRMQQVSQAMQNPAGFLKQRFPDIPAEIMNNPNHILQYLQQTRNISNEQIQNIINQLPKF